MTVQENSVPGSYFVSYLAFLQELQYSIQRMVHRAEVHISF